MSTRFRHLGPFEIEKRIGHGGMGIVFLATDTRNGRQVALKLLETSDDTHSPHVLDAERRGAELQEQFCRVSPYVPAVYERGHEEGDFYIAMEYLEGEDLSKLIARGPVQVARAVHIALHLCRFLEVAHSFQTTIDGRPYRSLLHGDLTPRNIRVLDGDEIKVLDFGIAKALSLSRKVTRNEFGNYPYLPPERFETGEMDVFGDFWAVGVLIYEMVRGVQPFHGTSTDSLEKRITSRQPPQRLEDTCPIGLRAIVAKLLAGDRVARYADATSIRKDLERFQSGQTTQAEAEGWADPATSRVADEPRTRRTRPPVESPREHEEAATRHTVNPPPPPRASRFGQTMRTALFFLFASVVLNELWVGSKAHALTPAVAVQEFAGLNDMWQQYDALSHRSLGMATSGLQQALVVKTTDLINRVVVESRSPVQTTREGRWLQAREALVHALAVSPNDAQLKSSLRFCEGHLHRINGEARRKEQKNTQAQREFTDAVDAFNDAARLRPNGPDPYLGLVRTFIYDLEDVDRAADALAKAQKAGYTPGERESAQLADGYKKRADASARTARSLRGDPAERALQTRVAADYLEAIRRYAEAPMFGNAATSLLEAQRGLKAAEDRLAELDRGTWD